MDSSPRRRLDLSRLLTPRAIAVVGATDAANSIGGMPMRYLTEFGFKGSVYPVNPKRDTLKGLRCYPTVLDVPEDCDVALVAIAAKFVPDVIRQCGRRNIPFAVVLSAGFGEAGEEGRLIEQDLRAALRETGVRMVGPNCLGLLNVSEHIHNGFGGGLSERGHRQGPVAMVTQSGGYGFTLVRNAHREGIGFQYVVSVGNSLDLSVLDFIEYFLEADDVKVVAAFVEGVDDGRRLIDLGRRALEINKPILIWKAGKTSAGQKAASSHTASMAASYALYRAAFKEGGYVELDDYEQFVDVTRAFLGGVQPAGRRIAIVTGSGGAGVVASDRCEQQGLELATLGDATVARLRDVLPEFAVIDNPVDISGQRTRDGSSVSNRAGEIVLADPAVDMIIVRSRQTTSDPEQAEALADTRDRAQKPVFVVTGADEDLESKQALDRRRLPWHLTVGRAAFAARALADFAGKRRSHRPESGPTTKWFTPGRIALPADATFLGEWQSREILAGYGIGSPTARHVAAADIARMKAIDLAYPLAVKVDSAHIPHKTEANAVQLNVGDLDTLKSAAADVIANARRYKPDATIDGVVVQEMAKGVELIAGAVDDPCFGPVVMFGLGGIFAEVMQDVTYRFAPFDTTTALTMVGEIKAARVLQGYRGQPVADQQVIAEFLSRLSWLITDHAGRIDSIDINPVFVNADRLTVADALVVLKGPASGPPAKAE